MIKASLNDIPSVDTFFGMSLKSGTLVIAILGIVHPLFYNRCFQIPSNVPKWAWQLTMLYFVTSIVLLVGTIQADGYMVSIWVWYVIFFLTVMLAIMLISQIRHDYYCQNNRSWSPLGLIWYLLTIYFVFVVNSHRKQISKK